MMCTIARVYGYQYSSDLIKELDRKFVNEQGVYTKFYVCSATNNLSTDTAKKYTTIF